MIHRRKHPELNEPGCFGCKISSVGFSSIEGGTRGPWRQRLSAKKIERDQERYKAAVDAGLRPEASTEEGVRKAEQKEEIKERGARKLGYKDYESFARDNIVPLKEVLSDE